MKKRKAMKRVCKAAEGLLLLVMLLMPQHAVAQIEGIYYNLNKEEGTAC